VGAAILAIDAGDHAIARSDRQTLAVDAAANDRSVRVLLCATTLYRVAGGRSVALLVRHSHRHREKAVYYYRLRRVRALDSTGDNVDQRDDASLRQALEDIASIDIRLRRPRRLALLLAGEIGRARAVVVRGNSRSTVRLADLEVAAAERCA